MSLKEKTEQVLVILLENLRHPQPQLVSSTEIAGQMDIDLQELQHLLINLQGQGVIETDPDQQFSLITPKGLNFIGKCSGSA